MPDHRSLSDQVRELRKCKIRCSSDVHRCIKLHILPSPPRVAVLKEITSFSPAYSQGSGRLHPSYTYTIPSLLSDIDCGYVLLRLSAITAPCPRGSLPSRLSTLVALCPAIYLSDATASGRSGPKMSKNACPQLTPHPSLCTHRNAPSTPNQDAPPQPFSLVPGSMFDLYDLSYKRPRGSACVLARCGVESSGIFVALWPTCVVLSRYVSSPVA